MVNTQQLIKFQSLKRSEYGIIRLLIEEQLADGQRIEQILTQITIDRINLAKEKLEFSKHILESTSVSQKTAITLSYYAMYHAARAVIFNKYRTDIEEHEAVSKEIRKILGDHYWRKMIFWRSTRNQVDYYPYPQLTSSLEKLSENSISDAEDFLKVCINYLKNRGVTL